MITGVVLAAGRSTRMGRPKALLEADADGESFLSRCIRQLRAGGCDDVIAVRPVSGGGEDAGFDGIARGAGARIVVNPEPGSEQIASLRIALRSLSSEVNAVIITPVDAPAFRRETVAALIDAFRRQADSIVIPTHDGERGHPTLFGRHLFSDLRRGSYERGARGVIAIHEHEVREVPVDDPGVPVDVDTPSQYRRVREMEMEP